MMQTILSKLENRQQESDGESKAYFAIQETPQARHRNCF